MASTTSNATTAPLSTSQERRVGQRHASRGEQLRRRLLPGNPNPAAHELEIDWYEQTALEYLAALSVLARWIDKASVEIP
jgi:hypothetical protein